MTTHARNHRNTIAIGGYTSLSHVLDEIEYQYDPADRASMHSHAVAALRRSSAAPTNRRSTDPAQQKDVA
jgi:hypothetical protein